MLNQHKSSKEKGTKCLCPKCGDEHEVEIYWTGRGIPRLYCYNCKSYLDRVEGKTYPILPECKKDNHFLDSDFIENQYFL